MIESDPVGKQLRQKILSVVPIVDARDYIDDAAIIEVAPELAFHCSKLSDDLAYFQLNFSGVG